MRLVRLFVSDVQVDIAINPEWVLFVRPSVDDKNITILGESIVHLDNGTVLKVRGAVGTIVQDIEGTHHPKE